MIMGFAQGHPAKTLSFYYLFLFSVDSIRKCRCPILKIFPLRCCIITSVICSKKNSTMICTTHGSHLSFMPGIPTVTRSYLLIFGNTSCTLSFPQSSPLPEIFLKGRVLEFRVKLQLWLHEVKATG